MRLRTLYITFILAFLYTIGTQDTYAQGKVTRPTRPSTTIANKKQSMDNPDVIVKYDKEWVDLGLPSGIKWATCNLGASKPEEYGNYFTWGSTKPDENFSIEACPTYDKSIVWLKVIGEYIDDKGRLRNEQDAAYTSGGYFGGFHMPTIENLKELFDNTTSEWITLNGVNGRKLTSKINGRSIFIPASGVKLSGNNLPAFFVGEQGGFWSSNPDENDSKKACAFGIDANSGNAYMCERCNGLPIRPVME